MTETTASGLIESYDRGEITLDQLVAAFEALPMRLPRSMRRGRTWADVYREAECVDDDDIPLAVSSARYAGLVTEPVAETLIKIYRRKMRREPRPDYSA